MEFKQVGPTSPAELNEQHRLMHDGDYLEEHIKTLSHADINEKQREWLGQARAALARGERTAALGYFNRALNNKDASMGYTKGKAEVERLKSEIKRLEETQALRRSQGVEGIAAQYQGKIDQLKRELAAEEAKLSK